MYAGIITNLRRRASKDLGTEGQHKAQRERNQAARLLFTNGVVSFICLTPWQFTSIDRIVTNQTGRYMFLNINCWYSHVIGDFM